MKANQWLAQAQKTLTAAGIGTARLDALVLLEDCLNQDRAYLLADESLLITDQQHRRLNARLARRARHEPLAYVRRQTEFYGREFYVNNQVLEPRPESETMIDLVKRLAKADAQIADIGSGSGALAITAKLELPNAQVTAVDIDKACLAVTARNARLHQVNITSLLGNLLEPFLQKSCNFIPDVLLCNLPYVPDNFHINTAASHEPKLALFGGTDGLDVYRSLFAQTELLPSRPLIYTESLPPSHPALANIAKKHGYTEQLADDFIQLFKPSS